MILAWISVATDMWNKGLCSSFGHVWSTRISYGSTNTVLDGRVFSWFLPFNVNVDGYHCKRCGHFYPVMRFGAENADKNAPEAR